jgi:uncharacterized protein DUF6629
VHSPGRWPFAESELDGFGFIHENGECARAVLDRGYGHPVCFSPEGDVAGGLVVTAIGIDTCRHLRGRKEYLLLAALPLVLGAHLLIESLVWWQLRGDIPHEVGRAATWLYLLIALVVVPVLVPVAVMMLEPTLRRRLTIAPFVLLGTAVAVVLLVTMLHGPITVRLGSYHLGYSIGLHYGVLVVGLYVVATCGSLLMSGYRHVVIFGLANVVAVITLARLTADGFTSLWCFYAALACGAICLHMRYGKPHRAHPYAFEP